MATRVGAVTRRAPIGWWRVPLSVLGRLRRMFIPSAYTPSMVYAEDERMSRRILIH
ncbi:MAG: hypothetical protein IIB33_05870 [Chloroflexi bacterium]|nr:hypothetical protein [Chloroflexota bacterium]